MKEFAVVIIICALLGMIVTCGINEDNNRHEEKMWCLNHGGQIEPWSSECKAPKL